MTQTQTMTDERPREVDIPLSQRIIQCWFSGISAPQLTQLADAAPELLEACKAASEILDTEGELNEYHAHNVAVALLVAIARAEGK